MKHKNLNFRPGAVFSNLLLADEINRTSPKTQAALLEAMEEHNVTVDGVTYDLPHPFITMQHKTPWVLLVLNLYQNHNWTDL